MEWNKELGGEKIGNGGGRKEVCVGGVQKRNRNLHETKMMKVVMI